jgi:hypothetical protein
MANKRNQLQTNCNPMFFYNRKMKYSLPVKPSPNLPNDQSINLYAAFLKEQMLV